MLTTILAATLIAAPAEVKARITAVSMFKNGYAMIMREVDLPASGEAALIETPVASLGSFWITGSDGVKIQEVLNTTKEVKTSSNLTSLDDLLAANVGKQLRVGVRNGDKVSGEFVVGKLVSATGQLAVFSSPGGTLAINKGEITSVSAEGENSLTFKVSGSTTQRVLQIRTSGSGKVYLAGLEKGILWAPSYAIDISDPKELTLNAKATVLDDAFEIDGIEARFVTGFPNVPWATLQDPLMSGQSVDQFTQFLGSIGLPSGGFGGGGARRDAMTQNAAGGQGLGFDEGWGTNGVPGVMAEDLFLYRQPNVKLKPGDRAYYFLFKSKASYEHLYTLDLPGLGGNEEYTPVAPGPSDVWHSLKFKNTSGQPLTTGPGTVFKDGQIMGQDTIMYTSNGAELLVKMSKALDVRADYTEEETGRERNALRIPNSGTTFDLVTVKGTLVITNRKPEEIKMRIHRDFVGELVSADGSPKSSKTAKALREVNPHGLLEWTPTIEKGKSLTLTYTFKLYVRPT